MKEWRKMGQEYGVGLENVRGVFEQVAGISESKEMGINSGRHSYQQCEVVQRLRVFAVKLICFNKQSTKYTTPTPQSLPPP